MIIKKIHIENFGKLHDFDLELENGLNEICNQNGFGKTTLSIFIKAMFYGMPPSRENVKMERKKYMPWQGGNFGGYIEFEESKGSYRITRFFGKTPESDSIELLDLSTNKIVDLKDLELGESVFGVGKDTFEKTAFFPQLNFSVVANEQMSANILGLDKFKFDLANLNTAVVEIKKKIAQIKRDKPQKEEIDTLIKSLNEYKDELSRLDADYKKVNTEISYQTEKVCCLEEKLNKEIKNKERQNQFYQEKQRLEDELIVCQEKLNTLLFALKELNCSKSKRDPYGKQQPNNRKILGLILLVMGALGSLTLIVFSVLKVQVIASVCLAAVSVLCLCLGLILILKHRNKYGDGDKSEAKLNLEKEISDQTNKIDFINDRLKDYEGVENPNLEEIDQNKQNLYEEKLRCQYLVHEKESISQKIELLIEKMDFINEELLNKKDLLEKSAKNLELLSKTKEFLMQANENVSSRFVKPANQAIKEILTKFDMRSREFVIDTNFDIKEVTSIGVKEQEYSSQGYKDILAFCVRLYLLKEIYKKEKPFIMLDDSFVNLDDENMLKAKEIIFDLKKQYQIIYMCCNDRCKLK